MKENITKAVYKITQNCRVDISFYIFIFRHQRHGVNLLGYNTNENSGGTFQFDQFLDLRGRKVCITGKLDSG